MARQYGASAVDVAVGMMHERDDLAAELERVEAELQDERTARLLVDNRVTELEDAIREHRRLILERVPQKSGRKIDEALWWWIK